MAIPSVNEFNRPTLEIAAESGDVLGLKQIINALKTRFSLTEEDIQEELPSGRTRVYGRTTWAVFLLKNARLLDSPARGKFHINQQGRDFLAAHNGVITNQTLSAMASAIESQQEDDVSVDQSTQPNDETTPEEQMASGYKQMQDALADEMLVSLKNVDPYHFEQLVVDLLVKMGYGEGQQVGGKGDGGIDGIINQDLLGLEKVYIQAKRWQGTVGAPEIYNFAGGLAAKGAAKGVFITTSHFTPSAKESAQNVLRGGQFIRLIDGGELARLMITHNVGVITEITYRIKKLDENYFAENP